MSTPVTDTPYVVPYAPYTGRTMRKTSAKQDRNFFFLRQGFERIDDDPRPISEIPDEELMGGFADPLLVELAPTPEPRPPAPSGDVIPG